ncbi:hypothetical protein Gotri_010566 [Gossypium trilobum]|uniref:Uncharacterized protein n=1 Tax=Gossypium trilobum TaxID=34281 RepID=A0A7J9EQU8_9ROSI|nr:hypothetical protein [Gossypium trilobum]
MPLGLILGIGRTGRKRASSLDILSSKRAPRDYLLRGQELQVYRFPHSQRFPSIHFWLIKGMEWLFSKFSMFGIDF